MMHNSLLAAIVLNALVNLDTHPDAVVDESCWSDPDFCLKEEFQDEYDTVLAEREAWDTARNHGLDLVVVCLTSLIIGPQLLPGNQDCGNVEILAFLDGSAGLDAYVNGVPYVHTMDMAEAHVRVFEAPEAKGRYFCFGNVLSYADDVPILAKLFPEHPLTDRRSDKVILKELPFKFSNQKLRDLGLKFTPTTQCIYDIVKSLQKTEHLPIINTT